MDNSLVQAPDTAQTDTVQPPAASTAHAVNAYYQPGDPAYWQNPGARTPPLRLGMPQPAVTDPNMQAAREAVARVQPMIYGSSDPHDTLGSKLVAPAWQRDPADIVREAHGVPNNPKHAAGNAMSYLVGRMEGILHGVTAAGTAQAASAPPASLAPPGTLQGMTINGQPAPGPAPAPAPDPAPTQQPNQTLAGLYGQDAANAHTAAQAATHPAHHMTEDEYVNMMRGTTLQQRNQLLQHWQPPALEDQARKMMLQQAYETGGPKDWESVLRMLAVGPQNAPGVGVVLPQTK